jgi:hypothetical protein
MMVTSSAGSLVIVTWNAKIGSRRENFPAGNLQYATAINRYEG